MLPFRLTFWPGSAQIAPIHSIDGGRLFMAESRRDPVRWRRPRRSTLLRLGVVATLLIAAALGAWAAPAGGVARQACAPSTTPSLGDARARESSSAPEPDGRAADAQAG